MGFLDTYRNDYLPLFQEQKHRKKIIIVTAVAIAVLLLTYLSLFPLNVNTQLALRVPNRSLLPIGLANASAVFNTVQGALRNKDSEIHPIGVSFIPAYIPTGTLLYHGNGDGQIKEGLEWVAMDYEFSYSFATHDGRRKPHNDDNDNDEENGKKPGGGGHMRSPNRGVNTAPNWKSGSAFPPRKNHTHDEDDSTRHSSLFTLEVIEPLNKMILLDGSSAAKTDSGEMDQQMILAAVQVEEGLLNERETAKRICKWGEPFGLDGFIRIEIGYEAIICNMLSPKLKIVNNVTLQFQNEALGLSTDIVDNNTDVSDLLSELQAMSGYDFIKAGNIHDKREGRILLDYRGLQTPLNRTWIDEDTYTRRIINIPEIMKKDIRDELETFYDISGGADPAIGTDWQLITTEIVDKFSPMLTLLNQSISNHGHDEEDLLFMAKNLTLFSTNFVRRFVDVTIEDEDEQYRLAKQNATVQYAHFLNPLQTDSDVLIYSSIYQVTESIVDILFDTFKLGKKALIDKYVNGLNLKDSEFKDNLHKLESKFQSLLKTLKWTVYYECDKKCGWDEVCFTSSWGPGPMSWGSGYGIIEGSDNVTRISTHLECVSYKALLNR